MVALWFTLLLLALLFIGMPVVIVMFVTGFLGITYVAGLDTALSYLSTAPYRSVNGFTYSALPLFILMAYFISRSKIADDLFDCLKRWVGHLPGGIGIATVFSSAGFGALSGSSFAANAIMSRICIPQLIKSGYSPAFASGLVATNTGTLAALIPPSILLIIYGIQTETSIGRLLIAGIVPGLVLCLVLSVYVVAVALRHGYRVEKSSWRERLQSTRHIWPFALLVACVIVVMYTGIGTSTEAAAFGALGSMLLGLAMKRLNFRDILESLVDAIKQTATIYFVIVGAYLFSYFVALTRVGNQLLQFINGADLHPLLVLAFIIFIYLLLGMFLDSISILLLTLPIVLPIIKSMGYDPIWFGVIAVILLEIGLVTPPVGLNLFITSANSGIPVNTVLKGSWQFILILLLCIALFIAVPELVTYLPYRTNA